MQDFIIAVSSTADLSLEWLNEHNVPFIPYTFVLNDQEYEDDCTDEIKEFVYEQMRNGNVLKTSAISMYAYHEFFDGLMKTGKDVLFIDMSNAISSSINNAVNASKMIQEEYPDQRFYFLDSYCITNILGLLVKELVAMREAGKTFDEVIEWGEANKLNMNGRFMVDDLEWLRRGGRLSNASAFAGMLLSIKPVIYVNREGKLIADKKVHGKRKAWQTIIADMASNMTEDTRNHEVMVIHSGTEADAETFKGMIQSTYPELTNVSVNKLGPVITAHVGPGFMAAIYLGNGRD